MSRAWTVTRYSLPSCPEPRGDSKSGGLVKVSAPPAMAKSLLSTPAVSHSMSSPSGSVALKV